MGASVTIKVGKDEKVLELEDHTFKSKTTGFYYRDRVTIGKTNYHVQIIISSKE
jgi:hypothetical protein